MLAFKGSHGTSLTRALGIKTRGFDTKPGRIGKGAYFWTAVSDEHLGLSTDFAVRWAQRRKDERRYRDDKFQAVTVVEVDVEVEEDDVLYLDDPDYHLELRVMLSDAVKTRFGVNSPFDVTRMQIKGFEPVLFGIIEAFIVNVEKELEHDIKAIFKCQVPPVDDPLKEYIGLSSCFSIRDTSCIKDMRVIRA